MSTMRLITGAELVSAENVTLERRLRRLRALFNRFLRKKKIRKELLAGVPVNLALTPAPAAAWPLLFEEARAAGFHAEGTDLTTGSIRLRLLPVQGPDPLPERVLETAKDFERKAKDLRSMILDQREKEAAGQPTSEVRLTAKASVYEEEARRLRLLVSDSGTLPST